MIKNIRLTSGIILLLLLICGCGFNNDQGQEPSIPLELCHLSGGRQAMCAVVQVPENRDIDGGRLLDLNIAVIPAQSSFPEADPLFLLAGGPGQAATRAFAPIISLLDEINETRDIVLVDQRGTGDSSPLRCDFLESEQEDDFDISDEAAVEIIHACAQEMAEAADLSQYTTDDWAADLDAVREALGYEKINLYGQSYGTRAAQAYARLFPDHVRTLTLDAVTGPELILFFQMPADGQRSMELLFERCRNDAACSEQFPNFQSEYEAILSDLEAQPLELQFDHPLTGAAVEYTLTRDRLTNFVYAILYSSDLVSLLPHLVHQAYDSADFAPLISQGILVSNSADMNLGLLYAVTCSEDAPLIDRDEAESIQAGTLFGPRAAFFLDICQAFPKAEIDPEFRDPLQTDLPVLLLSGEADPVTPPYYADQVANNFPNSEHIVLPGFGHGLLTVGCTADILAQFIEGAQVSELDSGCLDEFEPPPFFIDSNGPEA